MPAEAEGAVVLCYGMHGRAKWPETTGTTGQHGQSSAFPAGTEAGIC